MLVKAVAVAPRVRLLLLVAVCNVLVVEGLPFPGAVSSPWVRHVCARVCVGVAIGEVAGDTKRKGEGCHECCFRPSERTFRRVARHADATHTSILCPSPVLGRARRPVSCGVPEMEVLLASPCLPSIRSRSRRRRQRCPACASLNAAPVTTGLKEWASVVASLAHGETSVLLRKGGIAEKGFKLQSRCFAFYPTAFHDAAAFLQPGAAAAFGSEPGVKPGDDADFRLLGECTAAWQTDDGPGALAALAAFHPWNDALLATRLNWRPADKLTIVEVRAWVLPQTYRLGGSPDHGGCKSWLDLPAGGLSAGHCRPALDDAAWERRQRAVRAALAGVSNVTPLELPR